MKRLNQTAGQVTLSENTTGLRLMAQRETEDTAGKIDISEKVLEKIAHAVEKAVVKSQKAEGQFEQSLMANKRLDQILRRKKIIII